jgi:hypothetical protein
MLVTSQKGGTKTQEQKAWQRGFFVGVPYAKNKVYLSEIEGLSTQR